MRRFRPSTSSLTSNSEGALTIVFGAIGYVTIPHSPNTAWWLTPAEKAAFNAYMFESGVQYIEAKDEKVAFFTNAKIVYQNPMVRSLFALRTALIAEQVTLMCTLTFFSGILVFAIVRLDALATAIFSDVSRSPTTCRLWSPVLAGTRSRRS